MFKLVVLSALFAAAAAKPQLFYSGALAPATYGATLASPISTYVAPTVYSDIAFPHFIKKRSPQFFGDYVSPYVAGAPLISSYPYSSSLLADIAAPAHLIKKRAASWITDPATYISGAPLTYSSGIIPAASYYTYPGYVNGLPFIKK